MKAATHFEKTFQGGAMRPWEAFSHLLDVWFVSTACLVPAYTQGETGEWLQETLDEALRKFDRAGIERRAVVDMVEYLTGEMVQHKGDFLGELAGHLQTLNGNMGQYFTPACVSDLLARITAKSDEEVTRLIDAKGYTTCHDCAAGSGALLIEHARRLREMGFDPKFQLFAEGTDLDRQAFMMLYIQLSAYDIPARVILGDSLTLETARVLYTPAYHCFFKPRRNLDALLKRTATIGGRPADAPAVAGLLAAAE
jgi:hypothetical protein